MAVYNQRDTLSKIIKIKIIKIDQVPNYEGMKRENLSVLMVVNPG